MLNSITDKSSYRFTQQQWRAADIVMQHHASIRFTLRQPICVVVKEIEDECIFGDASRKPSSQAIRQRYTTYFLGLDGKNQPVSTLSLEEQANNMVERGVEEGSPVDTLAVRIKSKLFPKSSSELHTHQEIRSRCNRSRTKTNQFEGLDEELPCVAASATGMHSTTHYVESDLFPVDESIDINDAQANNWGKLLCVPCTDLANNGCDSQHMTENMQKGVTPSWTSTCCPRSTIALSSIVPRESASSYPSLFSDDSPTLVDSATISSSEGNCTSASSIHQVQPPRDSIFRRKPRATPRKRPRRESGTAAEVPSQDLSDEQNPTTSRQESIFRKFLSIWGFKSASKASPKNTKSLCARIKRFSLEVKPCPLVHDNPTTERCWLCKFPKYQSRPVIYLPPEYADITKAGENGSGTTSPDNDFYGLMTE